jgi:tyrosine-protein phosphatase YwqE
MLRLLQEAGASTVVATSHIYPGKFPNGRDRLAHGLEQLEAAREDAGIPVELVLGAEHYLGPPLLEMAKAKQVVDFGPERYVLFETHTGPAMPVELFDVVYALLDGGFTPLMAHVERYPYLRDEAGLEICEDLRSAGVRFQVNRTVGKVNVPGQGSRGRFLERCQARGWIDEVGSDLHRPTPEGRPYAM